MMKCNGPRGKGDLVEEVCKGREKKILEDLNGLRTAEGGYFLPTCKLCVSVFPHNRW